MNWFWIFVLGLLMGWAIELLIDYLFWQRKCEESVEAANARLAIVQSDYDGLQAQLTGSTSATAAAADFDASSRLGRKVAALASAGGVLGSIGTWLRGNDEDEEPDERLAEFRSQIAASASAATTMQSELDESNLRRDSLQTKVDTLEGEIGNLRRRLGFLLGAGGLLGSLGNALLSSDEEEVQTRVEQINDELNAAPQNEPDIEHVQVTAPAMSAAALARDRLTDINGVGQVFQQRLNEAHIYTFEQVAATEPDRLKEIVQAKEWQNIDPESWIQQARELAQHS